MIEPKKVSCLEMLLLLAIYVAFAYAGTSFLEATRNWKRLTDAKILGLEQRVANLEFQLSAKRP